jgi:hypothetical protein
VFPLVRDLAALYARMWVPLKVPRRILGFSPQAFHKWVNDLLSARDWADVQLVNALFDVRADDPTFGYCFIADELAELGFSASKRHV